MSPREKTEEGKASRRVTEDEGEPRVAAAAAIRFINNYSLCTRENYSLYPPPTASSPVLIPLPRIRLARIARRARVFIQHCVLAELR